MMCLRTIVRGSRSRSSRSAYSGPSSSRSSSRAALANCRALRTIWPACLARSGSRSGPKTITATNAMRAISASPTPNTGLWLSEPAGGREPELHPGKAPLPPGEPVGDLGEDDRCGCGRVGVDDRLAGVASLAQRQVERDATEHGYVVAEARRERLRDPVA